MTAGVAPAVDVLFTQSSIPAGFIDDARQVASGTFVSTTNAPALVSGFRFAYWAFDGTVQRDVLGHALNPVTFRILAPVNATAHYVNAALDSNTNDLPDWWELNWHTSLVTQAASDVDADGFSVTDEYRRDYHPSIRDVPNGGGTTVVFARDVTAVTDTNLTQFSISSSPPEFVQAVGMVTNRGARIVLPDFPGVMNGMRFACWTLNGVIQTDQVGCAYGGMAFTIMSNTVAEATFLDADLDSDGNGVADWYEWQFLGGVGAAVDTDADGDGLVLRDEYRRDCHPTIADAPTGGGTSLVYARDADVIMNTNLTSFALSSFPAEFIVPGSVMTNRGAYITLPDFPGVTNGMRFAYWTLNGTIQTDQVGRAYGGMSFMIASNTVAEATFLRAGLDADDDGLPDWYEWQFRGGTGAAAVADDDGDGLTLLAEYRRDAHPGLRDAFTGGGTTLVFGNAIVAIMDTNLTRFSISSIPAELVTASTTITNIGTLIALPDFPGPSNGVRFAYWTLNGVIQTDRVGRAYGGMSFAITSSTVAEAVFLDADLDGDGDGVPDWYEWHYAGGTNGAPGGDGDLDALTCLAEFRRDYHPGLRDTMTGGGTTIVYARPVDVSFRFFPRIVHAYAGGVPNALFTQHPPDTGVLNLTANSAPAVGDWDGDLDLDVFVGGAGGQMRVFENAGSPQVLNLVERTTTFATVAGAWTNLLNVAPALGDWSGDGKADLAIGGSTDKIWLVQSPGSFSGSVVSGLWSVVSGSASAVPAFGDVNADGWTDLLVLTDEGLVQAYTNSHLPLTPYPVPAFSSNLLGMAVENATGLTTADANDDGVLDVLISDQNGNIWEFHGAE